MILDSLNNAAVCRHWGGPFQKAIDFIESTPLEELSVGRHPIDGDDAFALVFKEHGKAKGDSKLETHRRYADIQIIFAGTEQMGWKPLATCISPDGEHDSKKDIRFYNDEPDTWFTVNPGQFVLFLPEDGHLPMISEGEIHKMVIKVAVR